MNIFKLGQKGMAHFVMPLLVVVGVGVVGLVAYEASHADTANTSTKCIDNTYGPGQSGPCISAIQYIFNGLNPFFTQFKNVKPPAATLAVNGSYGPASQDASKPPYNNTYDQAMRWQDIAVISIDGYVGPQTWSKLCSFTQRMANDWQTNDPKTSPPGYMVNAINAANNAGCAKIKMPT